jgi:hypothetical protein
MVFFLKPTTVPSITNPLFVENAIRSSSLSKHHLSQRYALSSWLEAPAPLLALLYSRGAHAFSLPASSNKFPHLLMPPLLWCPHFHSLATVTPAKVWGDPSPQRSHSLHAHRIELELLACTQPGSPHITWICFLADSGQIADPHNRIARPTLK